MNDERDLAAANPDKALTIEVAQLPFAPDTARLDQHFLVSTAAVEHLVELADVRGEDVVADVGSGVGTISAVLARRAHKVLAVEIDRRFEPMLRRLQSSAKNVEVHFGDFLDVDLSGVNKIVANPPFGLLEPMLRRLCDAMDIRLMAFVLGRHSADVLRARIGAPDFTRLTLLIQAYFDVSVEATLPKMAFHPAPRTDASIVLLQRPERPTRGQRILRILVRAAAFKGGTRVRDVAATIGARPVRGSYRIKAEQLSSPDIWSWRLQRLSNTQLSVLAADFIRLAGEEEPATGAVSTVMTSEELH